MTDHSRPVQWFLHESGPCVVRRTRNGHGLTCSCPTWPGPCAHIDWVRTQMRMSEDGSTVPLQVISGTPTDVIEALVLGTDPEQIETLLQTWGKVIVL